MILGAFICGAKRPLKELHVLDAGMATIIYIGRTCHVQIHAVVSTFLIYSMNLSLCLLGHSIINIKRNNAGGVCNF